MKLVTPTRFRHSTHVASMPNLPSGVTRAEFETKASSLSTERSASPLLTGNNDFVVLRSALQHALQLSVAQRLAALRLPDATRRLVCVRSTCKRFGNIARWAGSADLADGADRAGYRSLRPERERGANQHADDRGKEN